MYGAHGKGMAGVKSNLDIESRGGLAFVDWVWISGALIFVALMCFCIILLAHGAEQSATTQAQAVLSTSFPSLSLQPRPESHEEAAQSIVVLPETQSESAKSSNAVLSQRAKNRGETGELANTNTKSEKAIHENRRNLAVTRRANQRRSTIDKGMLRSVKMLIKSKRQSNTSSRRGALML